MAASKACFASLPPGHAHNTLSIKHALIAFSSLPYLTLPYILPAYEFCGSFCCNEEAGMDQWRWPDTSCKTFTWGMWPLISAVKAVDPLNPQLSERNRHPSTTIIATAGALPSATGGAPAALASDPGNLLLLRKKRDQQLIREKNLGPASSAAATETEHSAAGTSSEPVVVWVPEYTQQQREREALLPAKESVSEAEGQVDDNLNYVGIQWNKKGAALSDDSLTSAREKEGYPTATSLNLVDQLHYVKGIPTEATSVGGILLKSLGECAAKEDEVKEDAGLKVPLEQKTFSDSSSEISSNREYYKASPQTLEATIKQLLHARSKLLREEAEAAEKEKNISGAIPAAAEAVAAEVDSGTATRMSQRKQTSPADSGNRKQGEGEVPTAELEIGESKRQRAALAAAAAQEENVRQSRPAASTCAREKHGKNAFIATRVDTEKQRTAAPLAEDGSQKQSPFLFDNAEVAPAAVLIAELNKQGRKTTAEQIEHSIAKQKPPATAFTRNTSVSECSTSTSTAAAPSDMSTTTETSVLISVSKDENRQSQKENVHEQQEQKTPSRAGENRGEDVLMLKGRTTVQSAGISAGRRNKGEKPQTGTTHMSTEISEEKQGQLQETSAQRNDNPQLPLTTFRPFLQQQQHNGGRPNVNTRTNNGDNSTGTSDEVLDTIEKSDMVTSAGTSEQERGPGLGPLEKPKSYISEEERWVRLQSLFQTQEGHQKHQQQDGPLQKHLHPSPQQRRIQQQQQLGKAQQQRQLEFLQGQNQEQRHRQGSALTEIKHALQSHSLKDTQELSQLQQHQQFVLSLLQQQQQPAQTHLKQQQEHSVQTKQDHKQQTQQKPHRQPVLQHQDREHYSGVTQSPIKQIRSENDSGIAALTQTVVAPESLEQFARQHIEKAQTATAATSQHVSGGTTTVEAGARTLQRHPEKEQKQLQQQRQKKQQIQQLLQIQQALREAQKQQQKEESQQRLRHHQEFHAPQQLQEVQEVFQQQPQPQQFGRIGSPIFPRTNLDSSLRSMLRSIERYTNIGRSTSHVAEEQTLPSYKGYLHIEARNPSVAAATATSTVVNSGKFPGSEMQLHELPHKKKTLLLLRNRHSSPVDFYILSTRNANTEAVKVGQPETKDTRGRSERKTFNLSAFEKLHGLLKVIKRSVGMKSKDGRSTQREQQRRSKSKSGTLTGPAEGAETPKKKKDISAQQTQQPRRELPSADELPDHLFSLPLQGEDLVYFLQSRQKVEETDSKQQTLSVPQQLQQVRHLEMQQSKIIADQLQSLQQTQQLHQFQQKVQELVQQMHPYTQSQLQQNPAMLLHDGEERGGPYSSVQLSSLDFLPQLNDTANVPGVSSMKRYQQRLRPESLLSQQLLPAMQPKLEQPLQLLQQQQHPPRQQHELFSYTNFKIPLFLRGGQHGRQQVQQRPTQYQFQEASVHSPFLSLVSPEELQLQLQLQRPCEHHSNFTQPNATVLAHPYANDDVLPGNSTENSLNRLTFSATAQRRQQQPGDTWLPSARERGSEINTYRRCRLENAQQGQTQRVAAECRGRTACAKEKENEVESRNNNTVKACTHVSSLPGSVKNDARALPALAGLKTLALSAGLAAGSQPFIAMTTALTGLARLVNSSFDRNDHMKEVRLREKARYLAWNQERQARAMQYENSSPSQVINVLDLWRNYNSDKLLAESILHYHQQKRAKEQLQKQQPFQQGQQL